ncbi:MAG: transcription elongation factor GreA [Atopobiaceae bacterium]|nr:transcription elongation factor GreA [Atopobiaceae bacterium]
MPDNNELTLTPEGRQALVDELAYLEGERSAEIIERLKAARGFGDLSENSEYDDAKEEQAKNAARIAEIRKILSTAKVSESSGNKRDLKTSIGCIVEIEDEKGRKVSYTIGGTTETNSLETKISNESPLGAALMGHMKGDVVEISLPNGKTRSVKITSVKVAKK